MWRKLFGVGALSPAKFADLVAEIGVANGTLVDPTIDYEAMRILGKDHMVNLGNLYAAFLRLPRRERLTFITNALVMPWVPEGWEQAKPQLMPVVRDGAYLVLAELTMLAQLSDGEDAKPKENHIARRPLVAGLFRTLVIDGPSVMSVVNEARLEDWGVDFDTAFEVALSNLRAKSQDAFRQVAPGLWMAPWPDSFAAARLLLPEILQRVCTDPLVCVPNRDVLIVADPQWPDAFDRMVLLIATVGEDERYPITRTIFQLENKTLRPFVPPADQPASAMYDKMRLEEQVRCYSDEKELRDQIDEEAFYGTLLAYELEDDTVISRAVWTEGCDPGYLPPAQAIHFVKLADDPKVTAMWEVPWDVVLGTPGMLTVTDAPLPRWRIGAFPSDTWLDKHGERVDSPRA